MKNKHSAFPSPSDGRERLVDRIGADFYDVTTQLTTGLQQVLEAHGVAPPAREAVGVFVHSVVQDLTRIEGGVVRLANVAGAPEAGYGVPGPHDPISGLDPREHGHPTLSSFFQEIRQDEAARKREGQDGVRRTPERNAAVTEPEATRGTDLDRGM
jgi:hypothetical protein